jgi:hypothetical protein
MPWWQPLTHPATRVGLWIIVVACLLKLVELAADRVARWIMEDEEDR